MVATAYILAGLRFSEEQLDVFFKEDMMKESVTYQKILEQGRSEGETLGEARGEAHALLKILAVRGFAVSKKLRQRVLACQDLALGAALLQRRAGNTVVVAWWVEEAGAFGVFMGCKHSCNPKEAP